MYEMVTDHTVLPWDFALLAAGCRWLAWTGILVQPQEFGMKPGGKLPQIIDAETEVRHATNHEQVKLTVEWIIVIRKNETSR